MAKLVVAAAWADGKLTHDEINALKDLVFRLPDINARDWEQLEIYIDSPVGEAERLRLLANVQDAVRSKQDKQIVLDTLRSLAEADGDVSAAEIALLRTAEEQLDQSTGILGGLGRLIAGAAGRRSRAVRSGPNREERIDDFIRNTVYFQFVSEMEAAGKRTSVPEDQVRKLCLVAGMLAHVAWVDSEISEEEKGAIVDALRKDWQLPLREAELVCRISLSRVVKGLDYARLSRGLFECTTLNERRTFLVSLFRVAESANRTSNDEIEEIRKVAGGLKLSHRDFIAAKTGPTS